MRYVGDLRSIRFAEVDLSIFLVVLGRRVFFVFIVWYFVEGYTLGDLFFWIGGGGIRFVLV